MKIIKRGKPGLSPAVARKDLREVENNLRILINDTLDSLNGTSIKIYRLTLFKAFNPENTISKVEHGESSVIL